MLKKQETSFGIIPIKTSEQDGTLFVLLILQKAGHWCFPKGHPLPHESPQDTAKRELFEETGLTTVHLFSEIPLQEDYQFYRKSTLISKKVFYFVAKVTGSLLLQKEEVLDAKWVPLQDASSYLTFPQGKVMAQKALSMALFKK